MLLQLLKLLWMVVTLPFFIVFHRLRRIFTNSRVAKYPIEGIIEKSSMFLSAQIETINEIEGNKYGFFTIESAFYMIAVGEKLGGRTILEDERDVFLLSLLGADYKPRLYKVFESFKERDLHYLEVKALIDEVRDIAEDDIRKGLFFCSNFLVKNAHDVALWQRSVSR